MSSHLLDDAHLKSTIITVSATVNSGGTRFWGLILNTDGTNDAVVDVFDGDGGTKIFPMTCVGADETYGGILPKPIFCSTSLHVTVSGTGAEATVFWQNAN